MSCTYIGMCSGHRVQYVHMSSKQRPAGCRAWFVGVGGGGKLLPELWHFPTPSAAFPWPSVAPYGSLFFLSFSSP